MKRILGLIAIAAIFAAGCGSNSNTSGTASTSGTPSTTSSTAGAPKTTALNSPEATPTPSTSNSLSKGSTPAGQPGKPATNPTPATTKPSPSTAVKPGPGEYVIKLQPKDKETASYDVKNSSVIPTPKGQMPIETTMVLHVQFSTNKSGNVTEVSEVQDVDYSKVIAAFKKEMGANADKIIPQMKQQIKDLKGMKVTSVLNPQGEVVTKATASGNSPMGSIIAATSPGGQLSIISYPHKAVKIGDKWDYTLGPQTGTCTLDSIKTIGGVQYGVIKLNSKIYAQAVGTSTGTLLVNLATGVMRSAHVETSASGPRGSAKAVIDITQK